MAFDKKGGLLVATFDFESNTGNVYRIAPGASKAVNLNMVSLPGGALGADAAGNIYVGGVEGNIFVYAPGSKTVTRAIDASQTGFYSSFSVAVDGTIYWPNYDNGEMFEFAPGASSPTNVFPGGGGVDAALGPR
jgi:hypothetical protein